MSRRNPSRRFVPGRSCSMTAEGHASDRNAVHAETRVIGLLAPLEMSGSAAAAIPLRTAPSRSAGDDKSTTHCTRPLGRRSASLISPIVRRAASQAARSSTASRLSSDDHATMEVQSAGLDEPDGSGSARPDPAGAMTSGRERLRPPEWRTGMNDGSKGAPIARNAVVRSAVHASLVSQPHDAARAR